MLEIYNTNSEEFEQNKFWGILIPYFGLPVSYGTKYKTPQRVGGFRKWPYSENDALCILWMFSFSKVIKCLHAHSQPMRTFPYHRTLIFNIKSTSIDTSRLHSHFHICAYFLWIYYPTCNGKFVVSLFIYPNVSIICQGIRNVIRLDAWTDHGALWYVELLGPMWP